MQRKSTNIELVEELLVLNEDGRYDEFIVKARSFMYHDVLKPENIQDPKVLLVRELKRYPELKNILGDVLNCEYDEGENGDEVEDLDITIIN